MQAVILAGGKGTRLRDRLGDLPKPMVDLAGKPLLQHQIELARRHGFVDIVLLLGHNPEAIRDYFGDGSRFGVSIRHLVESEPLGSAGAVLAALDSLADMFLVLYGDTMLNVDLGRFWRANASSGADASLLIHPNDHPFDSDLVEVDAADNVVAFHATPHSPDRYYANLVNAALYIVRKDALTRWRDAAPPIDFARDLFPRMLQAGQRLHGYRSREYIKDAGTPKRLDHVIADYLSGRIGRSSVETPAAAIFVDRDGTINEEVNRVSAPEAFRLLPGVAEGIRRLNEAGLPVVVITNQPVIARGDCSEDDLRKIHNKMESQLGEAGAFLDAIYYCPHHPDKGFAGERPELKFECACRKPAIGLIEQACEGLNLDLAGSWFIGDSETDILTAKWAGLPFVLVDTRHAGRNELKSGVPEQVVASVNEAAEFILARRRAE
jgi:histidinol-phosphate phosphatase family protein